MWFAPYVELLLLDTAIPFGEVEVGETCPADTLHGCVPLGLAGTICIRVTGWPGTKRALFGAAEPPALVVTTTDVVRVA